MDKNDRFALRDEATLKNAFIYIATSWIRKHDPNGKFHIDDSNKNVVKELFYYCLGVSKTLDNSKGIWLEGPIGSGKTCLLYTVAEFKRKLHGSGRGFKIDTCAHIANFFSQNGSINFWTENNSGPYTAPRILELGFDELGRELGEHGNELACYMGNKKNVMQNILQERYSLWQKHGTLTHVTTNKAAEEIEALYGDFIRDRRAHMFNIIPLVRDSWRKDPK